MDREMRWRISRKKKLLYIAPAAILGIALFTFLGGEIVKLLWNWLLPPLFGFRQVGFWQALGLLALGRILFGGFGVRGSARAGVRRRAAENWECLTPEERERFRQRMRERWGFEPSSDEGQEQV